MKVAKQSVELVHSMGDDITIVNAARVSFAKESDWVHNTSDDGIENTWLHEKDQKLISYLARHNHWSPFAHAFLSFRIKAPIFVSRQLGKHQVGLAWNEVSRRYVDDEPEFYFPEVWRGKPVNAKQGSAGVVEEVGIIDYREDLYSKDITNMCLEWYIKNINNGMAPEQARMILPQNTMTEWIWSGSLMAFARVCKLRLDAHAQQETQEIAKKINDLIPKQFEHSWRALRGES